MDIAYDRVQEGTLSPTTERPTNSNVAETLEGSSAKGNSNTSGQAGSTLQTDLSSAFMSFSSTPWGNRLGGMLQHGAQWVEELQREANAAVEEGLETLRKRTGSFATASPGPQSMVPGEEGVPTTRAAVTVSNSTEASSSTQLSDSKSSQPATSSDKPESLPADILKEAGSMVNSLRTSAAARLRQLQAGEQTPEDIASRLGTNLRNLLKEAIAVSPPREGEGKKELLFETSEASGKKVFHATRLDAALHEIHTNDESFLFDLKPTEESGEDVKTPGGKEADISALTERISSDLEKYPDLRAAMERLVPEQISYETFWKRYYSIREVIEDKERKRREVLKGMQFLASHKLYAHPFLYSTAF
ncbi:hypothetical protein K470DRAFT_257824 [Piedraia hortae CBS 480.64]|uniref:BSD domain-containing protein n=1 Tax=Piedraia hortae CBS 480.64 TaxID=1314780 RepID=A0A6A7C0R2_9PEZI|nr:hypothetical protein K470DRAFT_257824 [Piedraia hortae CBS 480.64]